MIFCCRLLQACVSKCKIFTSFTHGFLLQAPSGLCLHVQDIHKFYSWFFITCSFKPVSPSARYSQVLHMVPYYMLFQAFVSRCKIFTSCTHGFLLHAPLGLCHQMQDIHKFYTWFYITCSFRPVSPGARYSQVLHMVFYYMLLQFCVSKYKIFTSSTHDFLLYAPSGLCLQMQDIHKFYTWFFITCSFMPVSPSSRYSQVLHMVFYDMLIETCVFKWNFFTSFTHGFLLHAPSGLCLQVQDIHKLYTWFTYNAGCV